MVHQDDVWFISPLVVNMTLSNKKNKKVKNYFDHFNYKKKKPNIKYFLSNLAFLLSSLFSYFSFFFYSFLLTSIKLSTWQLLSPNFFLFYLVANYNHDYIYCYGRRYIYCYFFSIYFLFNTSCRPENVTATVLCVYSLRSSFSFLVRVNIYIVFFMLCNGGH